MKPAGQRVSLLLALPAIASVLGGCVPYVVSGYGETPVYGDYGYVEPWVSAPVEVEGGYFVVPPYGHWDHGRLDEDRRDHPRREEAGPERRARIERPAPRPIPSIPNNPRPARPGGGRNRR